MDHTFFFFGNWGGYGWLANHTFVWIAFIGFSKHAVKLVTYAFATKLREKEYCRPHLDETDRFTQTLFRPCT